MTRVSVLVAALALVVSAVPAAAAWAPPAAVESCAHPVLDTASPVGTTSCPGIRPGARLLVPSRNAGCTIGFTFVDKYARHYVSTAGHCVLDEGRQAVWPEGKGPVVTASNGRPFGRFVFASHRGSDDIAVILVTRGIVPNPSVCHFGGPTGRSDSRTSSTVLLEHYGNGDGVSLLLPGRTGFAKGMPDAKQVYGIMAIMTGDSGGPVVMADNGRAVGYVTAIGYGFYFGGGHTHVGPAIVHRLGPQMALAMKYLKKTLYLRTAKHSPAVV